ncbi:MAG: ABC transporter substrate-binding protein [Hominimerdicola sp.]
MKAKRLFAASLAVIMTMGTMASLAGCGSSDSSSSGSASSGSSDSKSDNKSGVTLTVYTNRTDRVDDGTLDKLTDAFEKENDCTVNYVGLTDYSNDIKTKMSSGDYGDVLMIPDDVTVDELGNYFEPLGTYDEMKDTYSWINKKMSSDKTVYGIPYGGTATGILYNKKVWNDAGITELPKTADQFIEDLKTIKENCEGVVPYYTEYKDSWTISQWDSLVVSASGDPEYKVNLLKNKTDLFDKDGGYYKVYKMMFDLYSTADVLEQDHATTDWEASKQYFADGKIGAIVLGSWAISQFQEKAENPDDIGYMPVPITAADGQQYAQTSADYCVGVSKNSENKDLAKKFAEWFVKDSGFSANEGMISTVKGAALPDNLSEFSDCVLFEEPATPDEYVGVFDNIDKDLSGIGLALDTSDNFKFKIAELAFAGKDESELDALFTELNKKWAEARDSVLG